MTALPKRRLVPSERQRGEPQLATNSLTVRATRLFRSRWRHHPKRNRGPRRQRPLRHVQWNTANSHTQPEPKNSRGIIGSCHSCSTATPPKLPRPSSTAPPERKPKYEFPQTDQESVGYTLLQKQISASSTNEVTCALFAKTWGGYIPSTLTPSNAKTSTLSRIIIFLFFFAFAAALSSPTYSQEAAPTCP